MGATIKHTLHVRDIISTQVLHANDGCHGTKMEPISCAGGSVSGKRLVNDDCLGKAIGILLKGLKLSVINLYYSCATLLLRIVVERCSLSVVAQCYVGFLRPRLVQACYKQQQTRDNTFCLHLFV